MGRATGIFEGREVSFWDSFGPRDHKHVFSQPEIDALLAGKTIAFNAVSGKTGNEYVARGYLGDGERGFGFILDFDAEVDEDFSTDVVPAAFCGVKLTDEQRARLDAGERVFVEGCHFKSGSTGDVYLRMVESPERPGHRELKVDFDD